MKIPEILMVETVHQPGSLANVLQVIADAGLTIDYLQALGREQDRRRGEVAQDLLAQAIEVQLDDDPRPRHRIGNDDLGAERQGA